ncbi:MAG: cytosine permease [Rhodospirillaceae bacterium]|nr:cytosine permease [Rhodospirillaceae bacterium]
MLDKLKALFTLNEAAEAESADNPLAPTKPEHRQNTGPMLALAFGWGFLITGLLTGGSMAAGMPFWPDLIEAAFWGNLVNFAVGAAIGYMGYKTACNSGLLYRFTYGKVGVFLPVIFLALLTTGWQGIVVGAFGFAWVQDFNSPWFYVVAIFAGVLYTATTFYGVKGIHKVATPSVIVLVIVGIYAAWISIDKAGGWSAFLALSRETAAKNPITMIQGINLVIGSWIVGAVVMPEFTRFAKSGWVALAIPFIVLIVSQYFLQVIGAMGATVSGAADFTTYMVQQGFIVGGIALIGMSFALWTTGDANLYLPSVQTAAAFKMPQKAMVLVWGTLGTILGLGIYQQFLDWINVLANIVPPLVGPLIVDYYLVHRASYRTEDLDKLHVWNPAAVAAYVAGAASTFFTPENMVPALWGLIVSMIAYAVLYYGAAAAGLRLGYTKVESRA